jgi:hypothetical protein
MSFCVQVKNKPSVECFITMRLISWICPRGSKTFTLLVSYLQEFTFFITNMGNRKSANISHITQIMKVPMHYHDVAGESVAYYQHHEGAWFIGKHFSEENRAVPITMWNVKFRMC